MDPMSDSANFDSDELIARARAGDEAAWKELFDTCKPKVIRVVRRKLDRPLRKQFDSMDFVSDVMKSLLDDLNQLDFPSLNSLIAFLAKKAELKVIDEYRRQNALKRSIKRERALVVHDGGGFIQQELAAHVPTASQVAQESETRERLLAGQDEEQRKVIELKGQGHNTSEIAEQTGWSIRKVQRFLQDLYDSLSKEGDD